LADKPPSDSERPKLRTSQFRTAEDGSPLPAASTKRKTSSLPRQRAPEPEEPPKRISRLSPRTEAAPSAPPAPGGRLRELLADRKAAVGIVGVGVLLVMIVLAPGMAKNSQQTTGTRSFMPVIAASPTPLPTTPGPIGTPTVTLTPSLTPSLQILPTEILPTSSLPTFNPG